MKCEICSSIMSEPVHELFSLPTITSDCRAWSSGRSVVICPDCGVMKRTLHPLATDFNNIYENYKSYPEPEGRTKKILEYIKDKMPEPKSVLDFGTGTGSGLLVLQNQFPFAKVSGYEPTAHAERPSEKFDLITLFHVLEHVEDLHETLSYIKSSLTDNGHVLIQVPYTAMGPFDLVIADHIWHFNQSSLKMLLQKNGFKIVSIDHRPIHKEITLIGRLPNELEFPIIRDYRLFVYDRFVDDSINSLLSFKNKLDSISEKVAIYGTGPAAAWAGNILGDMVSYYLDDDINRMGVFNGKKVYGPYNGLPIIAPFPDWQLSIIKEKNPKLRFL